MHSKKGIIHLLPLFIVTVLIAGFVLFFTASRNSSSKGYVLKDSDERVESESSDNSGSGKTEDKEDKEDSSDDRHNEDGPDSTDSPDSKDDEIEKDEIDEVDDLEDDVPGVRLQTSNEEDEDKLEVRLSETERIRVQTKEGKKRIDVYQGGVKIRFEYEDGKLVMKAESEDESDSGEIDQEELFKVIDSLESSDVKISTDSGRITIRRGNASAVTDFPLSLDVDTNSLVVTTPAGEKTVAILPDVAIDKLLAANTISKLLDEEVELDDKDGEAVYRVKGASGQKFLGLVPVDVEKEVEVSAEDGQVVSVDQSFRSRLLDIFSF